MKKAYSGNDLFLTIPLPCLILDPESSVAFRVIQVNDAYLELTGKKREDLIGKLSCEVFPNNSSAAYSGHDAILASLQKALKTGKKEKMEMIRFDLPIDGTDKFEEKYWSNENIPLPNEDGSGFYILHTIRDVTCRVLAEKKEQKALEELNISKQQYRNFIYQNPDALYRLDLNGRFIHANDALAKLAELPLEKIINMDFLPFCAPHHKDFILDQFQKASQGISSTFEADFVSASGKHVVLKVNLIPMKVDEKVTEIHGIAKDVTSLRQTEKIMVEKSRFLEVNAAFINSLLENELSDEAMADAFAIIGNAVEVDRMYYFGAHNEPETGELLISQKIEWTSNTASPQINNPEMQNMSAGQLEEIMGSLKKNLPFTATLSELSDCALLKIFVDQDIKSMLLFPIVLDNQLYGFIGFDDCTRERIWSEDEVIFLQSLAHNFTSAIENRNTKQAIKLQEEQLRKSEQKFKALVQEGSDLVGVLDLDGYYSFVSDNYKRVLGFDPSELIGKNAFRFIHPEDWERVKKQFEVLAVKKQVKISPFRFKNSAGEWLWVETTATNLLRDPVIQGIVANSRDVTTIIEQAREIEQINERYKLAATATQDLIYDWDLEKDEVVRFHQSLKDLFGYPSAKVNKKDFWREHIHPDDLSRERRYLSGILADPAENYIKSEYRFQRADGTYAKVIDKGYIIRNKKGKAVRLIGATSDVSDITAKEEALKIANERFKLAMKATNEMIWDWEVATDSVTRSSGYKKIFGYDTNEATSVHSFWLTKIDPRDREKVRKSLEKALNDPNKQKWNKEYRIVKANGEVAHVTDRGFIIRDSNQVALRMIGAVLDVTGSRRLLREIKKQNKTLKKIAWEQSHVVRAPLARIKGLLYLIEEELFEEMSREEILEHLRTSADEMDDIVRGIVSKTENIKIENFSSREPKEIL